jgi:pantoate--beta-alanine ligase
VATIVAKLFAIVRPDRAFFGQKDYQQLKVIQRMNADLNFGVDIHAVPTVREADGLALSSRNRYLSARQRHAATRIPKALSLACVAVRKGEKNGSILKAKVRRMLRGNGISSVEYVSVVDEATLKPLQRVKKRARMAIAVRVGSTRLIDNMKLTS